MLAEPMRRATLFYATLPAIALWTLSSELAAAGAGTNATPSIALKTVGMEKHDGFFVFYWDAAGGKVWLEIPANRWGTEILYVNSLAAGIGSNDIGLDRGQLGDSRVVRFERVGPKVLLFEPNYRYRAVSESAAERRAVEESFAQSVLWGFEVAAEEDGRVLVDASGFLLRDAHGVAGRLRAASQGTYKLDSTRSAFYLARTKNFPKNSEFEALLTFTGDPPGALVRTVAPSADSITVRQHHSSIALPDAGYTPRKFDPRAGYFGPSWFDYAAPIGEPNERRFIARHRLKKKDPSVPGGEAETPIVYYLDPGTPEPIRSALLEGARWWEEAFQAAGFEGAFRVEMLPEEADPMDVRYNLIQWVHRSTRGWSYGRTITDPRTGEIIKGQVTLGSLRVRQDYRIAEGLLAPYANGESVSPAAEAMALARLRQLSAHEVGHTLGLSHNYLASTAGRASVMDYPHPLAKLAPDGSIDLAVGLNYVYAHRGDGQEPVEIVSGAEQRRALAAVLRTLSPDVLALPEELLQSIPPRPHGYEEGSRERFRRRTGLVFDAVAPAETSAGHALGLLLHPERAARLVEFHARVNENLGFGEVLDQLMSATWKATPANGLKAEIQRAVNLAALYHLMALAANDRAAGQVQATASLKLAELAASIEPDARSAPDPAWRAHYRFALDRIAKFRENPNQLSLPEPLAPPDGPPIGAAADWACDWQ